MEHLQQARTAGLDSMPVPYLRLQAHAVPKVDAPVRAAARHSSSRPMQVGVHPLEAARPLLLLLGRARPAAQLCLGLQVAHTSSSHFPSTSYGEEGGGPQQERHRVYIFDPESPGDIEESHLEPHPERCVPMQSYV